MRPLALLVGMSLLLFACGGSADTHQRVLRFTGRDESEANFRGRIREIVTENPIGVNLLCTQIRGLPAKEARDLLAPKPGEPDDNEIPKGATAKPGQKGDPKDMERAATILQEECNRMFPK